MKSLIALATFSLIVALPAQAGEDFHDDKQILVKSIQQLQFGYSPERMDYNFGYADTNDDGVLNRFEAGKIPGLAVEFNLLDLDRSKDLTREEFDGLLNLSTTNGMMTQGWHQGSKKPDSD